MKPTTSATSGLPAMALQRRPRPLLQRALALEHLAEGRTQTVDLPAAPARRRFSPMRFSPARCAALADHRAVGDDVGHHAGKPADHRPAADAHELVHGRQPAEDRPVLDHAHAPPAWRCSP